MLSCARFFVLLLVIAMPPFRLPAERLDDCGSALMRDLYIVDCVNRNLNDRLPVTFNHFLQGGYLNMPSARMADEGDIGLGYSYVPPYRNISGRVQLLPNLELTGSYRIFHHVADPVLSLCGFGDFADRGINAKLALLHAEDSDYMLPGIAIGMDDFTGTKAFRSRYFVLTQVWPRRHLEISLGYGQWRLKGLFGGALWMPWRESECQWLQPLALVAEYDAINYRDPRFEWHPKGRKVSSRVNLGVKYRLWNAIDLSASWVRGEAFACSASGFYNLGETDGLLPKIHVALPYCAPVNTQPIGDLRPPDVLAQDLAYAFQAHGLELLQAELYDSTLRLVVYNTSYYWEWMIRENVQSLLSCLLPANVDRVIVVIQEQGCNVQQYEFDGDLLRGYQDGLVCDYELSLLSPMREAKRPPCSAEQFFYRRRDWLCPWILPKTQFLFGSSRGKFKYAVGVNLGAEGYLPCEIYYRAALGYIATSDIPPHLQQDKLNPSQLPEVQTDIYCYLRRGPITLDEGFVQKNWNLGCGFFARASAGYFSQIYGGGDVEFLYYPVNSCWAIGIDGAYLAKRKTTGIGFTPWVRKLNGTVPTWIKFPLFQYFLDIYYDFDPARLDFKISSGRFLAGDYGARFEAGRNYPSGMRLWLWYTLTNAHDKVNGHVYHDMGLGMSLPLDLFFTCNSRQEWSNAISAWLRDCGVRTSTGDRLHAMIRATRR